MVVEVDTRLPFEPPEERPRLTPELAKLLLRLAIRRLEVGRSGDDEAAA